MKQGSGEGEQPIGSIVVMTDASGNANFDVAFPLSVSVNDVLTATATDSSGNTSEFSPCSTAGAIGVSVGDVSAAEGNSGTTNFNFPVTLSFPSTQPVVVNFTTLDGTAIALSGDYTATTGTISIPAGQTSATIPVLVNGDTDQENNETFYVRLTSATNATILDGQATGTILNDDQLRLILEESGPNTNQVSALDSVLLLRDPFQVINPNNLLLTYPADRNTRLMVFAENLQLIPGQPASAVVVNLIDSNSQSHNVAAEQVTTMSVSTLNLTQVVFRLPDGLPPGPC